MKSEIIPYNLIRKLAPGVANRQTVMNHLGKPKVVSYGNDFKVVRDGNLKAYARGHIYGIEWVSCIDWRVRHPL